MKTNRRRFLATLGATASATLLAPSVFDFKALAGTPFVRPDVSGLSSTDPIILGYQTAISNMQGLVATDVRSWTYQAAIHYTTSLMSNVAWDTCQHGTNLFWAWHRMYLYWWERIVRKYSGNSNWALPYWNWTANPKLPAVFQITAGTDLYTVNRNAHINNGTGALPATDVDYSTAFTELHYYDAQTSIEIVPHNQVHVDIGGWMSNVPTAAQDPIFYLHHANMDRLWDLWLAQGGGRSDPTNDTTWTGVTFTFFDENANTVKMTACDVLNAAAQLNYTYQGEPTQVVQTCDALPPWVFSQVVLLELPFPPAPIDGDPYMVPIDITQILQELETILANSMQQVYLVLDGVATETQPGVGWEVYVGLPAGVAPDPTSPFYVGKLALFAAGVRGSKGNHPFRPATPRFNITKALQAVVAPGGNSAPLSFFARGILVDGKQVTPKVRSTVTATELKFVVETHERRANGG
jgi:Common central domain of tyrosinase/Polyphenol oxidase middle domain